MSSVIRFYQYVNDEPAMIIARKRFDRGSAYVMCLSAAHEVLDMPGQRKDEGIMKKAMICAKQLGITTRQETFKIADIILEGLDALLKMPDWELIEDKVSVRQDVKGILSAQFSVNSETFEIDPYELVPDPKRVAELRS